jgi:SAM-dependent methyltransferase
MGRRVLYLAAEKDPLYLHALRNRFLRTPNVTVCQLDPENTDDFRQWNAQVDSALCINVLEYVENPEGVLASLRDALTDGGRLIVLVPQGLPLYGSIDKTLGHRRRFSRVGLRELLERAGFIIEREHQLNKMSTLAWFFYGRILGRQKINKLTLKLFDKTVWIWRRIDPVLPWPGLSLIAVARKR